MKKNHLIGLALAGSLGTFASIFGAVVPASAVAPTIAQSKQSANSCTPLQEVSTGQTSIRKLIDIDLFNSGNVDTDFAVPSGANFAYYNVTFTPENNATYDVAIYFKYSDGTSSSVFNADKALEANRTYTRNFITPTGEDPFQVNTRISGQNRTAYTIEVSGCQL